MKRVCIHQPDFLPYLGFFDRLLFTDVFIILDDVQFLRRGWHHRDKIKTKQGESWLTLSIKKGDYYQKINQVLLGEDRDVWVPRNLNLIKENYRDAPYFDNYFSQIKDIYQLPLVKMIDINMEFLKFCFDAFNLQVNKIFSSDLNVEGQNNQKLINLVKAVEGTHYLSGTGARAYLDEGMFAQEGIVVEWQEFKHPIYSQLHGEFIPYLSCIDLLFNCGPQAKDVLRSWTNEN